MLCISRKMSEGKNMDNHSYFIKGPRLFLREIRQSDVNASYYAWLNDPETTRYLEVRHSPVSMEEMTRHVSELDGRTDILFLAICQNAGRKHIGNIKLGPINNIHRFASLSILIGDKSSRGKGYASEAISVLADFAFNTLNLNRLSAGLYEGNIGSYKAFEKAGFRKEGIFRKMRYYQGKYVDQIMMGLIRQDMRSHPGEGETADEC